MSVCCHGQSWYKYRIRISVRVLTCRDLRDQVVDGMLGPTRIRDGLRTKSMFQTKNLGGNFTRFRNMYRLNMPTVL
jgi:hypothetical protein